MDRRYSSSPEWLSIKRYRNTHPYCTNWNVNPRHTAAVIIGNGPSRKNYDEDEFKSLGVTYGCNTLRHDFVPDYLVSSDPWYIQEIMLDGDYVIKHECCFRDWEPIPMDILPEDMEVEWEGYTTMYHGDRRSAESWFMWANEHDERLGDPMTAHVMFCPRGAKISSLKSKEAGNSKGVRSQGPSGAYAMQAALENGHQELIVIGFDALAGDFVTSSERKQTNEHKSEWKKDYESLINQYVHVEVKWRLS
jgi:hypothetical protein